MFLKYAIWFHFGSAVSLCETNHHNFLFMSISNFYVPLCDRIMMENKTLHLTPCVSFQDDNMWGYGRSLWKISWIRFIHNNLKSILVNMFCWMRPIWVIVHWDPLRLQLLPTVVWREHACCGPCCEHGCEGSYANHVFTSMLLPVGLQYPIL